MQREWKITLQLDRLKLGFVTKKTKENFMYIINTASKKKKHVFSHVYHVYLKS